MFWGSTDGDVFADYIEKLLPHCGRWLESNLVLVIDNASSHHTERFKTMYYNAGVSPLLKESLL